MSINMINQVFDSLHRRREALVKSHILYHGTSTKRLHSILSGGLKDPKSHLKHEDTAIGVYLTSSIKEAFVYAERSAYEDDANFLMIVVRTDVTGEKSFLDTDFGKTPHDFMKNFLDRCDAFFDRSQRKIHSLFYAGVDTDFHLYVNEFSQKVVIQHLSQWLRELGIKKYLLRDYNRAKNYLMAIAQNRIYNKLIHYNTYVQRNKNFFDILKEIEPIFSSLSPREISRNSKFEYDKLEATQELKLLLISLKTISTSDKTYTLRIEDTIGYSGPTRMIGIVSWETYFTLYEDQVKGKIGQIYLGKGIKVVQDLVAYLDSRTARKTGDPVITIDSRGIIWARH